MITWGTSFGSHDAALAVFDNGKLLFASHSERFSKKKDDANLSPLLIDYAISKFGKPTEIFYYEKPWKKRLRYLQSGQWANIFEFNPETVLSTLGINMETTMFHTVDHHRSHAAAGYYTSGFQDASVVVLDAIGEMATATIWRAQGKKLKQVYKQNYPHSIGLFYSALTQAAGFMPNREEYIFMGLAAYGDKTRYTDDLRSKFVRLDTHGRLVSLVHNMHKGCKHLIDTGINPKDLAAAGQEIYENCLQHVLTWVHNTLPSRNLVLMGGCALNCVANSKIPNWHNWNKIWIMPNPGDAGSAVGAVLSHYGHLTWPGPYLGYEIPGEYPVAQTLDILKTTGIVGVANGRAEFGPRALGNRSLLADPRLPDIKDKMNHLKQREKFRPFAAVIPVELASGYFDMENLVESPYMQYTVKCKAPDTFKGITHVDGTSRIQTVSNEQHPGLYSLLMAWYNKTGCPMLVNTSLNIKNQPLVNDRTDAVKFSKLYDIAVL
jgi:carbamoyltransferase